MGFLLGAAGEGAGAAATAGAADALAPTVAATVGEGAASAAGADALGATADSALTSSIPDAAFGVSSGSLNNFADVPGFGSKFADFGKSFGMDLARNAVQQSLQRVPGGQIIGQNISKLFDSPTIHSLFGNPQQDEISKRDDLINLLLKQKLGKA